MRELTEQIRRYAEAVEAEVPPVAPPSGGRRHQRRWMAAAAAGLLLVFAAVAMRALDQGNNPASLQTEPDAGGTASDLRPGWAQIPKAPLSPRTGSVVVATEDELVVWGGQAGGQFMGDGAAWSFEEQRWRLLAPSPLSARSDALSVWTGDEVVIAGGRADGNDFPQDLAAYDPRTDSWRTVGQAIGGYQGATGFVWTDTELVITGGIGPPGVSIVSDTWTVDLDGEARPVRAERPPLPGDPRGTAAAWTGHEVLVSSVIDGQPVVVDRLDPETGTWGERVITPATGLDTDPLGIAWVDGALVITGHHRAGATFDPGSGAVERLEPSGSVIRFPAVALDGGIVWVGDRWLEVSTRTWHTIEDPPGPVREFPGTAGHGGAAYAWGGDACGPVADCAAIADPEIGLRWVPPRPDEPAGAPRPEPSQTPAAARRDGVAPALAAMPYPQRVDELARVEADEGAWVLARPPHPFAGTDPCLLGDPDGSCDTEPIFYGEYGEVLLLDAGGRISRAYPMQGLVPTWILVTDGAVYAGRTGDGGLPASSIVRIDRRSLELSGVFFPNGGQDQPPSSPAWRTATPSEVDTLAELVSVGVDRPGTAATSWIGQVVLDLDRIEALFVSDGATPTPAGTGGDCGHPVPASPTVYDPTGGTYAALVDEVGPGGATVTFDMIQYLSGHAADEAWAEQHPDDPSGPSNDYMTINEDPTLRTAPVSPDAEVLLVRLFETSTADLTPGTAEELPNYLASPEPRSVLFWLTVENGTIVRLCEQYTP